MSKTSRLGRARRFALAGLIVVAASGLIPNTAQAHRSNYCSHGAIQGAHWTTYFDYHYNYVLGPYAPVYKTTFHYHRTSHYYSQYRYGFFSYRHGQRRICAVRGGVPIKYESVAPISGVDTTLLTPEPELPTIPPPLPGQEELCLFALVRDPDRSLDNHQGCNPTPVENEDPTDSPTFDDPGVGRPEAISASNPAATGKTLQAAGYSIRYHLLQENERQANASHHGDDRIKKGATRKEAPLVSRVRSRSPKGACITAITDWDGMDLREGHPPKRLAIEVASRRLAKKIGHGCTR